MSSFILYYLFLKPLSLLPLWVLYRISDFFYFVIYYIVKYRKKVVFQNLKNSFPTKSNKEIEAIAKEFYSHFCDLIIESLKYFSMSEKQLRRRYEIVNPQFFEPYAKQNKNIILTAGHYGNWEWLAVSLPFHCPKHLILGIYKPLKNKFFNKKMYISRSKTGLKLISPREVPAAFEKHKNILNASAFLTDQTPSNPLQCYWTNFLNQDTPVLFGTEKFAVRYNYPVIFGYITKIKRGYYKIEYKLVCENPSETKKYDITEKHTRMLEENIVNAPAYWLWSHRRWKHNRPENWGIKN